MGLAGVLNRKCNRSIISDELVMGICYEKIQHSSSAKLKMAVQGRALLGQNRRKVYSLAKLHEMGSRLKLKQTQSSEVDSRKMQSRPEKKIGTDFCNELSHPN